MPKRPKPQSRLTAQGQISVPARVREELGLSAGSVLEWSTKEGVAIVRRVGRYTIADLHKAVFKRKPRPKSVAEMDEGIARYLRAKHARR